MSYKPLPYNVTVKKSSIEGLGLFATVDIPKYTLIGYTHVYMEENITGDNWLRLPLGGFYNHSDEPNCISLERYGEWKELHTIEDIKAGEEITCFYSMYKL
jgi:SET domain-containing protein